MPAACLVSGYHGSTTWNIVSKRGSKYDKGCIGESAARGSFVTGARASSVRPNVLLIVSEDNGAELGCYGDPFVSTPHLDGLAAEGCRFANAYVDQHVKGGRYGKGQNWKYLKYLQPIE